VTVNRLLLQLRELYSVVVTVKAICLQSHLIYCVVVAAAVVVVVVVVVVVLAVNLIKNAH